MPLQKLQFRPGLNRDQTNYTNEGGWYECDKIRFRSGYPQKIGGWQKYVVEPLLGVCRQMFNYVTTTSDNIMFYGTSQKVYAEAGGIVRDITPYRGLAIPPATDNCFTTGTAGSTTVTVTIPGHGMTNGSTVAFQLVTGFDGIPAANFNTSFVVSNVTTNTFQITVATPCTVGWLS